MGRLITVLALLLVMGPAWAQDESSSDERARSLFDDGAEAYELGRYEDAIPLWEESWRLSLQPLILYNLANAYERAGHLEQALESLERYRPSAPSEERAVLDQRIEALEVRVAAVQAERDLEAAEDARREAERLAERQRAEQAEMRQERSTEQTRSPAGWLVGGLGVAALGTGLGFTVAAGNSRTQVATYCVDGGPCSVQAADYVARNRTHRIAAWTGLGVGAVGLGVGSVMIALPLSGSGFGLTVRRRW